LGREGRARALGHFTWAAIVPELEGQLLGLAAEGRRPRFLGLELHGGDRASLSAVVDGWISERGRRRARCLFYLNAHLANLAQGDPGFRAQLGQADLLLPDGQGVVLALRGMGLPAAQRLALGDVLPDLAASAAKARRSAFLWGADPGVAAEAGQALQRSTPGLRIAGVAHGFQDAPGEAQVLARLQRLKPGLLLLGMGSPKQEALALRLAPQLPGTVIAVCGNAFTFVAGRQRRAPRWMAGAGLEWLWRLGLEPRRLAVRYLWGNLAFARLALRARAAGLGPKKGKP
jgi:exopolysaccharide biosynthesis WecB/TagA/CpsF family protein